MCLRVSRLLGDNYLMFLVYLAPLRWEGLGRESLSRFRELGPIQPCCAEVKEVEEDGQNEQPPSQSEGTAAHVTTPNQLSDCAEFRREL